MKTTKLMIGVAGVTAALLIGAGVSFAVWTLGGSGSGTGAATVASSLTVTGITPSGPAASLYPGGPPASVYFSFTNPNPFAVTVTSITWGTPTSNNTTSCPSSNISIDASAPTAVSISIPANQTSGPAYQVPGVLDLAHSAPNGCQGVSFNTPMTITATQQ
jgi:hypothetical protein